MMKLIPFPGTAPSNVTFKKVNPTITPKNNDKLLIGPIEFTCIHCKTTNKFHMEGMIFRNIEFYCSCCGSHYKVSNPAFGKNTKSDR